MSAPLLEALTLWREYRHPALSALLLQLEDPAPPMEPTTALTQAGLAKELTDRLLSATDASRGPILAAFKAFAANALPSNLWPELKRWAPHEPADFRLAALALELLTRPDALREVTHKVAEALLNIIAVHGDRSHVAPITQWARTQRHWGRERDAAAARRALSARDERTPPPMTLQQFAGAEKRRALVAVTGEGDALYAAILERPDDDGLRLAWADWLLERGDERGELIVLQMSHGKGRVSAVARARERFLLQRYRLPLLGPLERWVALGSVRFRRGLPASVELTSRAPPALPEFRLLEGLGFRGQPVPDLQLPALRQARGVRLQDLEALLDRAPRLELLGLHFNGVDALPGLGARPATLLRHLEVHCSSDLLPRVRALVAAPCFTALESLTFDLGAWGPWLALSAAELGELPPQLREVRVKRDGRGSVRYRLRDGVFSELRLERNTLEDLRRVLEAFGAPLEALVVRLDPQRVSRAQLEAALAALPSRPAVLEVT